MKKISEGTLVKIIHEKKSNISESDIKDILDLFVETSKDSLRRGIGINLKGFVTLSCVEAKSKKAYNFKVRKTVQLPNRTLPKAVFNRNFVNTIKQANK